jgi:cytochrome c
MAKTFLFILFSVGFIFLLNEVNFYFEKKWQQERNTPPIVKIKAPKNYSLAGSGTHLHYSITVSDKEDGESKFDEINTKEVLLEVKYISDSSRLSEALKKSMEKDPPGLAAIRASNCFNCHCFETKVIGPGFTEIRKRYQPTATNIALLEKRIHEGSTGIWGKVSMPTHPELAEEQIQNMVKWIMENASENNIHYYVGTEGFLNVPQAGKATALLLTASYTDHGIKNSGVRFKGRDGIVVRVK